MRPHEVRRSREKAREAGMAARAFSLTGRWVWGPGAWEAGAGRLGALGGPLLLAGEASLLARFRKPVLGAFVEAGLELTPQGLPDGVQCSGAQAKTLAAAARAKGAQAIAGLGGGKVLDLVKWAGQLAGLPVAALPTSAATCACATGVAVASDEQGVFASVIDLDAPPALILADTDILRAAPPRLLAAGLADTLAKAMEWQALQAGPQEPGEVAGWSAALEAARLVRAHGAAALASPAGRDMEPALEACLLLSSQASCLGAAPAAVAHSVANGLSVLPEGRALLHGEQVALGLLVQDALLGALGLPSPEPSGQALRDLLASWALPGLPEAALKGGAADAILEKAMAPEETLHLLPLPIGKAALLAALRQALLP